MINWRKILGYRIDREPQVGDRIRMVFPAPQNRYNIPEAVFGNDGRIEFDRPFDTSYQVSVEDEMYNEVFWNIPKNRWKEFFELL